jgi:hypothetical protein
MKFLIVLTMGALMVLSGCAVRVHGHGHGHFRYRHHGHGHHRHHRHHHWNAPGPAYAEASRIKEIAILPSALPEKMEGEFAKGHEAEWRASLPKESAQLIAEALSSGTKGEVSATAVDSQPSSGYYLRVDIVHVDVGVAADGTDEGRGSSLAAHGFIVNATSGEVVADVKFTESSGMTGTAPFNGYMSRVGSSLAEWFNDKRGEK